MAYIGKFRDGWRAQIQRDGVRESKTFKTKRLAQAWVVQQEARETLSKSYTLQDAITKYLETVSIHKRDAVEWEGRRFGAMLEHFGNVPLDSITSADISAWRSKRMETVSGSTVLRESGLYRNLLRVAMLEWQWITSNPYLGVRLPKSNNPRVQVWRWQQIKRVLRAGQRVGGKTLEVTQAFHIALRTGMRLKEAIEAPTGFDRQRRVVQLSSTKTAKNGETVPLTKQAYRLMLTIKPFTVSDARASMLFCHLCNNLLIKDLQFRDARATALTLMARRMDVLTLARISRHKDLRLLISTYYRETPEDISKRL
jgi:site-specific recombinase XerD